MEEEQWIVKNNTKGPLMLPINKVNFKTSGQEKELCFHTGKTIEALEHDPEIKMNLAHQNIVTIYKSSEGGQNRGSEETYYILQEIKNLKKLIEDNPQKQDAPQAQIPFNTDDLIKAIKDNLVVNVTGNSSSEGDGNIVSSEEEKMKEEALRKLIFNSKKDVSKSFDGLGSEKEVINEAEGNEDLLDDIDI